MSLNIDLIIKIIIPILGAIVTYFIIPWIKANTSQKAKRRGLFLGYSSSLQLNKYTKKKDKAKKRKIM